MLCNTDGSPDRQRAHLQTLFARRVDGVVLASSFLKDPAVRWLRHQHVPFVLVNRYSEEDLDAFIGSDDLMGARLATQHLIDLGHTRIGHGHGNPKRLVYAPQLVVRGSTVAGADQPAPVRLVSRGGGE